MKVETRINKTKIITEFVDLLSSIDGVEIAAWGNDFTPGTPLVIYRCMGKINRLIQNRIERFTEWSFVVRIYANSSVECTQISDQIDDVLKPVGFIEKNVSDHFDSDSRTHTFTSVYSITLDEYGCSYNIK